MQLAGREAIGAQFNEIEPEHLLAALLKFSELPVDEAGKLAGGTGAARELAAEVAAVRDELSSRSVDSTRVRRELRAKLGKGNHPQSAGPMHRSEASKNIFNAAANSADDANCDTLTAKHLLDEILKAPTPVMAQVLGKAVGPMVVKQAETPLLDAHGQDLTALAAAGELPGFSPRQTEAKALLQALGHGRSVAVLCDRDEPARAMVLTMAQLMAGGDCPKPMKGKRLVDVSAVKLTAGNDGLERWRQLFAEASTSGNVILFVPPLDTLRGKASTGIENNWLEFLKVALTEQKVRFVCRAATRVYEDALRRDPTWKRLAQVMFVQAEAERAIPNEL